ncbi:MAG: hypothetical protein PHP44_11125 [Kiritimatiellae bacterium]|nr:hypothetical protein [Kiritimatiellia bacterium]
MAMDEMVVKETLDVLTALQGNPCEEKTLMRYVNQRLLVPQSTTEFAEQLADMKARGWVGMKVNDFGKQIWWLTDEGSAQRGRMK